jgi:hypothetical protein
MYNGTYFSQQTAGYSGLARLVYSIPTTYNLAPTYSANFESPLEQISVPSIETIADSFYSSYKNQDYIEHKTPEPFVPETFLRSNRNFQPSIGKITEILHYVEEAFQKTTGFELPRDISINLLDKKEFDKFNPNPNVMGFALNKNGTMYSSEIFIRSGELDKVLLVIGHELGHVMSLSLPDIVNEEAKAFAFTLAWIKTISDNNIAGLANSGVHNVALNFVLEKSQEGMNAMNLFAELSLGRLFLK